MRPAGFGLVPTFVLIAALTTQNPTGAAVLSGRWSIELWMDSAGTIGPRPTTRYVQGWLGFGALDGDSTKAWPDTVHWMPVWPGTFSNDLVPLMFGVHRRPAQERNEQPNGFPFEASAFVYRGDSVSVDLLPSVDHAGIDLEGAISGDTIVGLWSDKAYCCGASGHFRMVRTSAIPVTIIRPKPPTPRPPLPRSARADIRVRIYDDASKRYLKTTHGLVFPDGSTQYAYTTDSTAAGWGQSFWLPPGSYQIEVRDFECAGETVFLRKLIHRPFQAKAGGSIDITIHFNRLIVPLNQSYANLKGLTCGELER